MQSLKKIHAWAQLKVPLCGSTKHFENLLFYKRHVIVRARANCAPIYGDLYQNLQWSLTFDLKVVTYLKSAPEASYDVINMATIMRNCSLIKATVCICMVIFIQQERFF